jgi:hypothetical protein
MRRIELIPYLASLRYDKQAVLDKLVYENPEITLVRVRHAKKGVDTWKTNHISKTIADNPHWNCDWIYIIDNSLKMLDEGQEVKEVEE